MRNFYILILILGLGLAWKAYDTKFRTNVTFGTATVTIDRQEGDDLKVDAKVADTQVERGQGLMHVKEMDENAGMIFLFDDENSRRMWMENTYIPLDILFMDGKGRIFNFKENAEPLSRDLIFSVGPAKYVLEVNGGFIQRNGIKEGDVVTFEIKE